MQPDADEIIRALKKHPDLFTKVMASLMTDPDVLVVSPWLFHLSSRNGQGWRRIRLGYPPGALTHGVLNAVSVRESYQMMGMHRGPSYWAWTGSLSGSTSDLHSDSHRHEFRKDAQKAADEWLQDNGAIFIPKPEEPPTAELLLPL